MIVDTKCSHTRVPIPPTSDYLLDKSSFIKEFSLVLRLKGRFRSYNKSMLFVFSVGVSEHLVHPFGGISSEDESVWGGGGYY